MKTKCSVVPWSGSWNRHGAAVENLVVPQERQVLLLVVSQLFKFLGLINTPWLCKMKPLG